MPRRRRHIAGDTAQGGGAKPRLGFWVVGPMRGGGRGPVGVKCCAANSNLPPRRADPHAEGKTLWDKTPPRSAVFRVDPPLPSLPCSFSHPPANTDTRGGGGGVPQRGGFGALLSQSPPQRGLVGSISGRSRVDLGSISGQSRVDLGSISVQFRVNLGSISGHVVRRNEAR